MSRDPDSGVGDSNQSDVMMMSVDCSTRADVTRPKCGSSPIRGKTARPEAYVAFMKGLTRFCSPSICDRLNLDKTPQGRRPPRTICSTPTLKDLSSTKDIFLSTPSPLSQLSEDRGIFEHDDWSIKRRAVLKSVDFSPIAESPWMSPSCEPELHEKAVCREGYLAFTNDIPRFCSPIFSGLPRNDRTPLGRRNPNTMCSTPTVEDLNSMNKLVSSPSPLRQIIVEDESMHVVDNWSIKRRSILEPLDNSPSRRAGSSMMMVDTSKSDIPTENTKSTPIRKKAEKIPETKEQKAARREAYLAFMKGLPRFCSPTICGTWDTKNEGTPQACLTPRSLFSSPTNRENKSPPDECDASPSPFDRIREEDGSECDPEDWSIEHIAILTPADISVNSDNLFMSPTCEAEINRLIDEESDMFFKQKVILPSPMAESKSTNNAQPADRDEDAASEGMQLDVTMTLSSPKLERIVNEPFSPTMETVPKRLRMGPQ